ncbi:F-box protein At1g61340 [Quercus suber]|uniref:F-box protein At1g61340 n=1 Tax=Quercus suber TaxID=58331 RepID=UPI0032DEA91E
MALGKRCGSSLKSKCVVSDEELGLGYVRYARAFGRKRILISNHFQGLAIDSAPKTLSKKMCGKRLGLDSERSFLEALPQDILLVKLELKIDISSFFFAKQIRVLCGVNHKDFKQLFHVSKSIREALSKPHNPSSFKKFKP